MKKTYSPDGLPEDKKQLMGTMLKGIKLKNPYASAFLELYRMGYAVEILNKLIENKNPELLTEHPQLAVFKIPRTFTKLLKEIDSKSCSWNPLATDEKENGEKA